MSAPNVEDFYPLSPMQQGMVFHSLLHPGSGVYVEQTSCTLRGELDRAAFERAWRQVMQRHHILRTGFVGEGLKEPAQVVYRDPELPLTWEDWRDLPPAEQALRAGDYGEREVERGFVLAQAPLFRLALLRMADEEHRFIWTYHHALLDGWSVPQLMGEVFTLYEAYRRGLEPALPRPRPYRDFIVWLRRQSLAAAEAFWRGYLAGFAAPTPLGAAWLGAEASAQYAECELTLSAEQAATLTAMARRHGLTMNTLVQGAWALLLGRYSGEPAVLFGATVSGRPTDLPGVEHMIGLFINTLPVRVSLDETAPVAAWLARLQAQQVELRQYEYTPLVQIQGWSEIPRGGALFNSLMVFENYPLDAAVRGEAASLRIEAVASAEQTNYPLTLVAGLADELVLRLVYNTGLFDQPTVALMLGHLATILAGFAAAPQAPLAEVPLLTADERRQLELWNATARPFADGAAHLRFEEWATRTPDALAVQLRDERLTYAELNRKANQLAHQLRRRGLAPEGLVAICAERSLEQIVAMLAVLKAGGAYLPLDPTYPVERLRMMLDDARPAFLIAHAPVAELAAALAAAADEAPLEIIDLALDQAAISREPETNPRPAAAANHLAYVIYTSGSTGKPKGALLEHRGLVNLVAAFGDILALAPGDRVLQFFAFGFDGSVLDIFGALLNGATVCLVPRELALPGPELAAYLREQRVSVAMLPPTVLAAMPEADLPHLRAVQSGGEACTPDLVARWAPGRRFFNAYGPTEATVAVSWYEVSGPLQGTAVPLGSPIANTRLVVLDAHGRLAPVGVPGELHVGGVGLARGYLNRPELTAEKFIADPSSGQPGARLYRTGDLVRRRLDGTLVFLGRTDHQVKLRGFRIELGEIEAALCALPGVREAVVLAREDTPGRKRLVAYLVPAPSASEPFSPAAAREQLAATLPGYMLPTAFMTLAAFPLNPSGKVDRRALPAPEATADEHTPAVVAPRDELERTLVAVWEEALGVKPLGIEDDFFEHGGHSLLVVRAAALIEARLGRRPPLLSLFQHRTVAALASLLRHAAPAAAGSAVVPLQPAGERPPLFFIHPSGGSVHWYFELANQLGRNQPFYGLQARGVEGDAPLHDKIEEMGAYYAAALRTVQPEGPYFLGSWSLGVVLALETAQQLYAQGHEVALLAIFDQGPVAPGAMPADMAAYLIEVFGDHIPLTVEELSSLGEEAQVAHVLNKGQRIGWINREVTLAQFQHFVSLLKVHKQAWHHYTPRPYPGRVTLFRAAEESEAAHRDPERRNGRGVGGALARLVAAIPRPRRSRQTVETPQDGQALGWEQIAQGGVELVSVPGDHITMLQKPHVRTLAARLRASADAAAQPAAAVRESV